MTLRKRTILTFGIALLCLVVAVEMVSRKVWLHGFLDLEEREVRSSLVRGLKGIERETETLDKQAQDWSDWDDMYEFVQRPTAEFIRSTFVPTACEKLNLSFIAVIDPVGNLMHAATNSFSDSPALSTDLQRALGIGQPERQLITGNTAVSGVLIADGPVLISARPIRDSECKLPPRGTLVMGRHLDEHEAARLSDMLHSRIRLYAWNEENLPPEVAQAKLNLDLQCNPIIRVHDECYVDGYACLRDLGGAPALLLQVRLERDIYRQGQVTQENVVLAVVIACIVFAAIALMLVENFALHRVRVLSRSVRGITADGAFTRRIESNGSDELQSLACDVNHLLDSVVSSQDQVKRSRRVLETLLSNLPGMAYRCRNDRNWTMEFVSEGCEALTGYSAADLVGNREVTYGSLLHSEDSGRVWELVQSALAAREPFKAVYRIRTASGELRWMWEQGRGVFSDSGELESIEGFIADMTDQKRGEEELERAKEAAEATNRLKSSFLANMSHEIRTPMTAILGYADVMLDSRPPEPAVAEGLSIIKRNGEHLLDIINDILDLSKIEADKLIIERISCSPVAILGEIESLMRVRASQKHVGFHLEYATLMPRQIQSDPTRLRQILLNLVGNAVKFTEHGGVRVIASLEGDPGESPKLQIDVVDSGIGMTAQQIESIFQPFIQADASTSRRFGGTGLGLSISSRLAAMLGGRIEVVKSSPEEGTTFRLTLSMGPIEASMLYDPRQEPMPQTGRASVAADTSRVEGRVLLAEDGPDNQRLIRQILERIGLEVVAVEDGRQAVDQAIQAERSGVPFDVILMDMQMPVMDGYEATKTLRRGGYSRPIVALTAHAMSADRDRCMASGCDEYQTKPIDRVSLVNLVVRLVKQQRAVPNLALATI